MELDTSEECPGCSCLDDGAGYCCFCDMTHDDARRSALPGGLEEGKVPASLQAETTNTQGTDSREGNEAPKR